MADTSTSSLFSLLTCKITTYENSFVVSIIHFDRYSAVSNFKCSGSIFSLDPADIGFMAT